MFYNNDLLSFDIHLEKERDKEEESKESDFAKKLKANYKEDFDGWLAHPITKDVVKTLQDKLQAKEKRILQTALSSGIDKEVEARKILAYSLEVRALKDLLKVLSTN